MVLVPSGLICISPFLPVISAVVNSGIADKVKILQQTYGNDSTDIERIALVGCSTDGVNQNLAHYARLTLRSNSSKIYKVINTC
jgi:hypothetical protein